MKRLWFSIILLILLLGIGIVSCIAINRIYGEISAYLSDAQIAAQEDQWTKAASLSEKAQTAWEKHWHSTAALADHAPMERIDALFAQLNVYLRQQDRLSFCACCAQLSELTGAIGEDHITSWWNLL